MKKQKDKLTITLIPPKNNFNQFLAYIYLYLLEFVSDGLFVSSLNPNDEYDFSPSDDFFNKPHEISYTKKIIILSNKEEIKLFFDNENDCNDFDDEINRSW